MIFYRDLGPDDKDEERSFQRLPGLGNQFRRYDKNSEVDQPLHRTPHTVGLSPVWFRLAAVHVGRGEAEAAPESRNDKNYNRIAPETGPTSADSDTESRSSFLLVRCSQPANDFTFCTQPDIGDNGAKTVFADATKSRLGSTVPASNDEETTERRTTIN